MEHIEQVPNSMPAIPRVQSIKSDIPKKDKHCDVKLIIFGVVDFHNKQWVMLTN